MQTQPDDNSLGGSLPTPFAEILERCETYDLGPEEGQSEVVFTGRVLRSPRSGRFVLLVSHREQNYATALELDVGDVRGYELLFRDSSGRSTYRITLAAGCDVNLLQPGFGHLGNFRNAPPSGAADAHCGIQDPMEAWAAAPWRRQARPAPNPIAFQGGGAPVPQWSQHGDPRRWNSSANPTAAYNPSTGYGLADYGPAFSESHGYPPAGDATLIQPTFGQGPPSHPLEGGCGYGIAEPIATDPALRYPGHGPWRRY